MLKFKIPLFISTFLTILLDLILPSIRTSEFFIILIELASSKYLYIENPFSPVRILSSPYKPNPL